MSIIRQDYGNLADMATQQLLAPIFPTLVATKAVSKDGLFIINNTLYKATADIAQDAQIVVGTNAELASTIAEELNDYAVGNLTQTKGSYVVETIGTISIGGTKYTHCKAIIYLGDLGNSSVITVNASISNAGILSAKGIAVGSSYLLPLPYVESASASYSRTNNIDFYLSRSSTTISVRTGTYKDRTDYTAYAIVDYYV